MPHLGDIPEEAEARECGVDNFAGIIRQNVAGIQSPDGSKS